MSKPFKFPGGMEGKRVECCIHRLKNIYSTTSPTMSMHSISSNEGSTLLMVSRKNYTIDSRNILPQEI